MTKLHEQQPQVRLLVGTTTIATTTTDDDSSTSSTLAVSKAEHGFKKALLQQSEPGPADSRSPSPTPDNVLPPKVARTVRFNEESNQYFESASSCMSKDEEVVFQPQLQWYSRRECRAFRDENDSLARKIALAEGGYRSMRNPFGYQNVLQRVYEACCQDQAPLLPNDTRSASSDNTLSVEEVELRRWLTVDDGVEIDRWGLERMIVSTIALDRYYRRHALMDMVYSVQDEFESNTNIRAGEGSSSSSSTSLDEQMESLRHSCEALTRPSCLFALYMGQAIAAAEVSNC